MGRTVIIGDVHGMLRELDKLITEIGLTKDDTLVLVGDLIDKGPYSAQVVKYLRLLRAQGQDVVLVLGNHEEKHARFRNAMAIQSGLARNVMTKLPKFTNAADMAAITKELEPADVAFLDSAVLMHWLPEHGALVVHAGVLPGMESLPTTGTINARGDGLKAYRDVLRVRHVTAEAMTRLTLEVEVQGDFIPQKEGERLPENDWIADATDVVVRKKTVRPKGSFLRLGEEMPNDPYWATVYDGRFGRIFFGHNPFLQAATEGVTAEGWQNVFPHATGLDFGCVFGGHLAAAVLEVRKPTEIVTVKAYKAYAKGFWEDDSA